MKRSNSGIFRSSPITHQAKWLGTPVFVLPVNNIYEYMRVLKPAEQWFYCFFSTGESHLVYRELFLDVAEP
jgi:hypothetical protein